MGIGFDGQIEAATVPRPAAGLEDEQQQRSLPRGPDPEMFPNLRTGLSGLKHPTLIAIAAAIIVLVAIYLAYRWARRRNRSKYGFSLAGNRQAGGSDAQTVQRDFEAFIAEIDSAIQDILSDYASAHPQWERAPAEAGRWAIRLKSGRRGNQDDCFVRCYTAPSYEDGRLLTNVEVQLPVDLSERQVLRKALERAIRKSKSGRRAALNFSNQW